MLSELCGAETKQKMLGKFPREKKPGIKKEHKEETTLLGTRRRGGSFACPHNSIRGFEAFATTRERCVSRGATDESRKFRRFEIADAAIFFIHQFGV